MKSQYSNCGAINIIQSHGGTSNLENLNELKKHYTKDIGTIKHHKSSCTETKRAKHKKKQVKSSKRESLNWVCKQLTYQTPAGSLCQKKRRMTTEKYTFCKKNWQTYTSIPDIDEKLVQTFSKVFSDQNYSNHFMRYKIQIEFQVTYFISYNSEPYNKSFTLDELKYWLFNIKDTSPGEEQIHYKMIKYMHDRAKQYLVNTFNKLCRGSFFSTQWNTAIVTATPKPDKAHSVPANYWPIALTSSQCKTFERLIDYLKANKHKMISLKLKKSTKNKKK